ncbi:MAG: hypothetical protein JRC77_08405, partial [Deltaproteobacteria bacterium]|nr:hypothetical protein [Deltaproteobacteria bacterium]
TCDTFSDSYFCDGTIASSCTADREAKANCGTATYGSDLPAEYQYFVDPRQGGTLEVADYCPAWNAFSNGACDDPANYQADYYGESYTSDSYCFDTTLLDKGYVDTGDPPHGACYEMLCGASTLAVKAGAVWKDCPVLGGALSFSNYYGTLTCPAFADFCSVCGDDLINNGETCDDGDATGGDGCDAQCQVEDGYYCLGIPSTCNVLPVPEPSLLALQGLAILTLSGLRYRSRR